MFTNKLLVNEKIGKKLTKVIKKLVKALKDFHSSFLLKKFTTKTVDKILLFGNVGSLKKVDLIS